MRRGLELISGVGVRSTWVHACWAVEGAKRIRSQGVPSCPVSITQDERRKTRSDRVRVDGGGREVLAYEVE